MLGLCLRSCNFSRRVPNYYCWYEAKVAVKIAKSYLDNRAQGLAQYRSINFVVVLGIIENICLRQEIVLVEVETGHAPPTFNIPVKTDVLEKFSGIFDILAEDGKSE